jgi:hypothetical protein
MKPSEIIMLIMLGLLTILLIICLIFKYYLLNKFLNKIHPSNNIVIF